MTPLQTIVEAPLINSQFVGDHKKLLSILIGKSELSTQVAGQPFAAILRQVESAFDVSHNLPFTPPYASE